MLDCNTGPHAWNIYYETNACYCVRANTEAEAIEKFRTLNNIGKMGKPIVKITQIG